MGSALSTALCIPAYQQQSQHPPLRKQLKMQRSDRIVEVTKASEHQSGIFRLPAVADLSSEDLFREYYGGTHGSVIGLVKEKCEEFGDKMALAWRPIDRIEKSVKKDEKKSNEETEGDDKEEKKKPKEWRTTIFKPSESMTYTELWENAVAFGYGLSSLGLKRRAKVALYSDTCKEWLISCYGLWTQDLVGVTVYANLGKDALEYALKESEVEFVICQEKNVELLKSLNLPQKKLTVIYLDGEEKDQVKSEEEKKKESAEEKEKKGDEKDKRDNDEDDEDEGGDEEEEEEEGSPVEDVTLHRWYDVHDKGMKILKEKSEDKQSIEDTMADNPHTTALIMYTSGTTGNPKGCVLTHGNIYAAVKGYQSKLAQYAEMDADDDGSSQFESETHSESSDNESPTKDRSRGKKVKKSKGQKDDDDDEEESEEEEKIVIEPDTDDIKRMLSIRNPVAEAAKEAAKHAKDSHKEDEGDDNNAEKSDSTPKKDKRSKNKESPKASASPNGSEEQGVTPSRSRRHSVSAAKGHNDTESDEDAKVHVDDEDEQKAPKVDHKHKSSSHSKKDNSHRAKYLKKSSHKKNSEKKHTQTDPDFPRIDIADDVPSYVAYLPLAHILEFVAENVFLMYGGVVCYGTPQTLTSRSCKPRGDLEEFRPLFFIGVPRVFDTVKKAVEAKLPTGLKRAAFDRAISSRINGYKKGNISPFWDKIVFDKPRKMFGGRLRACLSGGAPLNAGTQEWMAALLGASVGQGFALTENCAAGCVQDFWDLSTQSSGTLLPVIELKLVDKNDWKHTNNPPQGEVWMRGPVVCKGYYKQEDKTREAFTEDGWFKTGDIGEIAENGNIKVIGRTKGLAKNLNGEYIAVETLESIYVENELVTPNGICVLVNSDKSYICAVLCIGEDKAMPFAKKHGIKGSYEEVLKDKKFNKKVAESLRATAESKGRQPFEFVKYVQAVGDEWGPENGILTAANKLKRDKVEEKYKEEISKMWENE